MRNLWLALGLLAGLVCSGSVVAEETLTVYFHCLSSRKHSGYRFTSGLSTTEKATTVETGERPNSITKSQKRTSSTAVFDKAKRAYLQSWQQLASGHDGTTILADGAYHCSLSLRTEGFTYEVDILDRPGHRVVSPIRAQLASLLHFVDCQDDPTFRAFRERVLTGCADFNVRKFPTR